MPIACEFCKTRKKTRTAIEMHMKAKHPNECRARDQAAQRANRKVRSHPFIAGMLGGVCGVALLAAGVVTLAVRSQALEVTVTPRGVTLKPWVVTVSEARR